jgi:hypothetical protein
MGAFLAIMAIAILLVRRSMRTTGIACQFCRNQRLTFFDELSDGQRSEILAYFRQHETRQPDETGIFVCLECMTVHDDFCGE